LARFQREAEVLASLNHPHIAAIYGLEESGGVSALVMELVEGENLAQRIERGAIPFDEALPIAKQIADALEAAHDQGIVHRDLKPANIKVRDDGTVKVLDFGLAKLTAPEGAAAVGVSQSPTLTSPAGTLAGTILGTAAYMSPEQARGKPVDKRSDIWAFSCVLFEMLTGRRAFDGTEPSDVVAAILRDEPDWRALPPDAPRPIEKLLRRCLQKERRERLADISDARLEIVDALSATRAPGAASDPNATPVRWSLAVPWAIAAVALVGFAWAMWARARPARSSQERQAVAIRLPLPAGLGLDPFFPAFALAPDEHSFVVAMTADPRVTLNTQLYRRRMDAVDLTPIPGTTDSGRPFFLDEKRLGFIHRSSGELRVVDLVTGNVRVICRLDKESQTFGGATPGPDDSIIYASRVNGRYVLHRVAAAGGAPLPIATPERGEAYVWPQMLPDGEHVLFTVARDGRRFDLDVLSLKTNTRRTLLPNATYGRYSSAGYLVFFRFNEPIATSTTGDLLAVPFDPVTITVAGDASVLRHDVPDVLRQGTAGTGPPGVNVSVAANALLILPTRQAANQFSLAWMDRSGGLASLPAAHQAYRQPDLSADGTKLVFGLDAPTPGGREIWTYDISRDVASRFTTNDAEDETPHWSPDAQRIIWSGNRNGERQLLVASADHSGSEQRLWAFPSHTHVNAWSSDGQLVYVDVTDDKTADDIWVYSFADRAAKPLLQTPASEVGARPSPDNRWLTYVSDESGRQEVYVRDLHGTGRVQVSREGGVQPMWSHDGRELFFRTLDGAQLLAVSIGAGTEPRLSAASVIFRMPMVAFTGGRDAAYAVAPDGKRFLVMRWDEQQMAAPEIEYVVNWFSELQQRVPTR